jgi:hypothetical protein
MLNESTILQVLMHLATMAIMLGFIVLGVYLMVLLIKLARRGVKVLDLVIEEKKNHQMKDEKTEV